uniref:Acyl-coenzyme A thioesterase THEM4 n=1 Tax=mine drainage metagenome TaxID=410659 RepID=E6QIM7_9ZZZZ
MTKNTEPPAHPWKPLSHGAPNRCFGCSQTNEVGLRLEFAACEDGTVTAEAMIGDQYEGPPGFVHGGIIATLLDEAMSKANRAHGEIAVTRQLHVEYLHPVPSDEVVRIEGRVERAEGRKLWTMGRILNQSGKELTTAKGFFIALRKATADSLRRE